MNTHYFRSSAYLAARCGKMWLSLLLAFVVPCAPCSTAAAQVEALKWKFEATIVEIEDSRGFFPDVQLGDPVHGSLKYNVLETGDEFDDHIYGYIHAFGFEVATMAIENPRTGNEFRFVKDLYSVFLPSNDIFVGNNDVDPNLGETDFIVAQQSVFAPPGMDAAYPLLDLQLIGPPDTLSDFSLPRVLDLDDWPIAQIFYDAGQQDVTAVAAEIHSLTPVPVLPGDYDNDDDVDMADYLVWRDTYDTSDMSADGNGDDFVNAADYTIWRNNLGMSSTSGSRVTAHMPEPAGVTLLAISILAAFIVRCRATDGPSATLQSSSGK